METDPIHLDSLLTDGLFDISSYQRSYSWTEPQLTDLFEDLLYLPEEKSHFFGNIIFRKQDIRFETDRRCRYLEHGRDSYHI
ncbi:DUF262 domain-containing protein [Halorubrum sp. CBA1229]|uniref:GmrSD restriction endonuclease domain-containing protein n=1 Tax=Halorubrum sp. CBA1229 TaxID=1853699 RepID=UPI0020D1A896|nr:DUF262 domain-containing protein [Halorubrum sp. CBA1229]